MNLGTQSASREQLGAKVRASDSERSYGEPTRRPCGESDDEAQVTCDGVLNVHAPSTNALHKDVHGSLAASGHSAL